MRVCDCYRQLKPIQLGVGECLGAKNKPKVGCDGDESRCLFYSDRRRKAKAATNADKIRTMSNKELAELMHDTAWDGRKTVEDPEAFKTVEEWLDWLKQEAT